MQPPNIFWIRGKNDEVTICKIHLRLQDKKVEPRTVFNYCLITDKQSLIYDKSIDSYSFEWELYCIPSKFYILFNRKETKINDYRKT